MPNGLGYSNQNFIRILVSSFKWIKAILMAMIQTQINRLPNMLRGIMCLSSLWSALIIHSLLKI